MEVVERERERRRAPRTRFREGLESRMYALVDAQLVDLSMWGALLEHVVPIRPGSLCELVIEENREPLRIHCRVIRSNLTRPTEATASREVRYHTGVEFMGLTPVQATFLEALIRRYGGNGGRRPPGGPSVFLLV